MLSKQLLRKKILANLNEKILALEASLAEAKSSRDSDTKSSAGDKHETSRARIQVEVDRLNAQLSQAKTQYSFIASLNLASQKKSIEPGTLISTNQGDFFISLGLGKLEIDGGLVYCISEGSPIAQFLKNLIGGKENSFRSKAYVLIEIQ